MKQIIHDRAKIQAEEEFIKKFNFLNVGLSNIVLRGAKAGTRRSEETTRCLANFKTQYPVLSVAQKKMLLSGPVKN